MAAVHTQRRMWIAVVATSLISLAALAIASQTNPNYLATIGALAFAAIGLVFCWAYTTDRQILWWAIIPGVGALTLLAALLADVLIGTDPSNDWVSGFVVGAGATITAAILKRPDAKTVLVIVAVFSFLIGIAMAPITALLKVVLIAAGIALGAYAVLRIRTTLRPQGL